MPAALGYWDELVQSSDTRDSLVLSFFSDERPLRGAAGLADWRLCGRLSRLIKAGHLSGELGENLMMPAGPRLPFARIFLFGLGAGSGFDEARGVGHAKELCAVLKAAQVSNYAVQVPGRATLALGARRAAEIWASEASGSAAEVSLIDESTEEKALASLLV